MPRLPLCRCSIALRLVAMRLLVVLLAPIAAATQASADTWIDTHDEPATVWKLDTSDNVRQLAHERVRVGAKREGEQVGAERLAYLAPAGQTATAWRAIPPAAVIDELRIELDARVTVPGSFLTAQIVLPRTKTDDDQPLTLRVRSAPAAAAEHGDIALVLENFPQLLSRQIRVWRLANRGKSIDDVGAYVARIGLGLPGTGGPAQAWIRKTRVESLVTPLKITEEGLTARSIESDDSTSDSSSSGVTGRIEPTTVTLRSDGFRVDGELFFPRIWRWRGEAFQSLADRGINTVWLPGTPTKQALADAARHRLRLICPPPQADSPPLAAPQRVLAWVLEGSLDADDLDSAMVSIEAVRALEGAAERPLLAAVTDDAAAWSRVVDGVILDPSVSRTTLARDGNRAYQRVRPKVPPGTPTLAVVSLEVGPKVAGQLDAMLGDGVALTWLPPADTSAAVHRALLDGSSGIVFSATERLDGATDATLATAGWLEATNRQLRLIEPWIVGPRSTTPLAGTDGVLLDRGGVRLAAFAPFGNVSQANDLDDQALILLPGLNATAKVSRLTPAGLNTWSTERIAGGVGVRAPQRTTPGALVMSNDPRVVRSLKRYTSESAASAAKNIASVAAIRLESAESLTPDARRRADDYLAEARLAASRRDYSPAYDAAHAALAMVADAEMQHRAIAYQTDMFESTPLAILPGTLIDHFRMSQLLASVPRGPNRLFGGSFEDIDELRRHGWRHTNARSDAKQSSEVELAAGETIHGKHFLRLSGVRGESQIVSPDIAIAAGETLEVSGWARVDGSAGVLRIVDSLGGAELALEIGDTHGEWKPFRLLRATAAEAMMTLTLSTHGPAIADVDGVMLRTVRPTGLANRPRRTTK